MINSGNINQTSANKSMTTNETKDNNKQTTKMSSSEGHKETNLVAASYESTVKSQEEKKLDSYTVDLEKVKAMKEETDLRMLELFKDTTLKTSLKQLGGVRGILEKLRNGEKVTLEIEFTAEDVEQAKIDVAEGGYWSAEETSSRLVDFAKALSGGDPEKAAMLKDSFVEAFKEIEEMFGGELPELSYETYDLTMSKFDAWETDGE